jgi:hypothetical protein
MLFIDKLKLINTRIHHLVNSKVKFSILITLKGFKVIKVGWEII